MFSTRAEYPRTLSTFYFAFPSPRTDLFHQKAVLDSYRSIPQPIANYLSVSLAAQILNGPLELSAASHKCRRKEMIRGLTLDTTARTFNVQAASTRA